MLNFLNLSIQLYKVSQKSRKGSNSVYLKSVIQMIVKIFWKIDIHRLFFSVLSLKDHSKGQSFLLENDPLSMENDS